MLGLATVMEHSIEMRIADAWQTAAAEDIETAQVHGEGANAAIRTLICRFMG
jgi:hypothetical protein